MALESEHSSTLTSNSLFSYDEKKTLDVEKGASPDVERLSPSLSTAFVPAPDDTDITYPEGGRDAWLVVLGAFCGLMASLGIYNTAGVFEVVVSKVILPEKSPSNIGWIFSTYGRCSPPPTSPFWYHAMSSEKCLRGEPLLNSPDLFHLRQVLTGDRHQPSSTGFVGCRLDQHSMRWAHVNY